MLLFRINKSSLDNMNNYFVNPFYGVIFHLRTPQRTIFFFKKNMYRLFNIQSNGIQTILSSFYFIITLSFLNIFNCFRFQATHEITKTMGTTTPMLIIIKRPKREEKRNARNNKNDIFNEELVTKFLLHRFSSAV